MFLSFSVAGVADAPAKSLDIGRWPKSELLPVFPMEPPEEPRNPVWKGLDQRLEGLPVRCQAPVIPASYPVLSSLTSIISEIVVGDDVAESKAGLKPNEIPAWLFHRRSFLVVPLSEVFSYQLSKLRSNQVLIAGKKSARCQRAISGAYVQQSPESIILF